MSVNEEQFPFEEFVQALSDDGDLETAMRSILSAIADKNIYWTYSAVSTILEILKSKQEDPSVKCRCLEAAYILIKTCQYPIITLAEVYLLPSLQDIAYFSIKKSQETTPFYFQQVYSVGDSPEVRKLSVEFMGRARQLIYFAATLKPYRTVQVEQLKQQSWFALAVKSLQEKSIKKDDRWKWCEQKALKGCRKQFLDNLKRFVDQSDSWAQFLLVNLLEEIKSGKKQLLQLRQLIAYGECYLTSPVINVCEDELSDLTEGFEDKRRYLGLLNELVRCGDIEAIIMIKNSQFLPAISARLGSIPGHIGTNSGQQIFPEIAVSKQVKKQFYCDFLRSLQSWAKSMPADYDSQQFNISGIYQFFKEEKKFKFPDNLHLARFEKEAKQNLIKNKERNQKLIEILQKTTSNHHSMSGPYSRSSQVVNIGPTMTANTLEIKLEQAQKQLKNLLLNPTSAESALKMLTTFKDSWIGYLEALNLQSADEQHLEKVVSAGQKCVQQIQLIVPLGIAFTKGKLSYKQFKQRVAQNLEFHYEVSRVSNNEAAEKKNQSLSRSLIKSRNSQVGKSQVGISHYNKSKIAGRDLRSRMKQKSKMRNISRLDLSKAMDRSNMSRYTDRSKMDRSKFTEKSRYTNRSKVQKQNEIQQRSQADQEKKNMGEEKSGNSGNISKQQNSVSKNNQSILKSKDPHFSAKSSKNYDNSKDTISRQSKLQIIQKPQESKLKMSHAFSHHSVREQNIKPVHIQDYDGPINKKQSNLKEDGLRKSNSKILQRRSHRNSKMQKSKDSVNSQSSRRIGKEPRSIMKIEGQLSKTIKVSDIQSSLKKNIDRVDETIEVNGNIIKEGSLTQKKSEVPSKNDQEYDDFKDGHRQISSIIHSNSVNKQFHHSAQKIFNNTIKKQSEIQKSIASKDSNLFNNQNQKSCRSSQQEDSQDVIVGPELLPMKHSYYKVSALNSNNKLGENPQFKQVFSNKYEGLESRQKQQKLLRNNQGLKNIIKSPKAKPSYTKDSVMYQFTGFQRKIGLQKHMDSAAIHQQYGNLKSAKDLEIQALEDKKNKQIYMLREKIKQLQLQTMSMRTKLAAKDNQLKSMKNFSISGSERGFAHFTSPAQSNYDRTSHSRSEKGSIRGGSISKKGELTLFQKQIQTGFKQFLEKIKGITFRKSLLKQKCLIHKSDQIQIGCLSQCGETLLECTLYVTPHRFDLIDFAIMIQHDSNLKIRVNPEQIKLITAKKQQKIHITIQLLHLPFCLPELQINYKATSEYSANYHRLTLPLGFNKFCQITALKPQSQQQSHILYIRSDDFKLNTKVVKLDKLLDSFSCYSVIPPNTQRTQWLLIAKCRHSNTVFNICMNLGEKSCWIQGFLLSGDPKPMNFFICTHKEILDAIKK